MMSIKNNYAARFKGDFFLRHIIIFGFVYFIIVFSMVSEVSRMWSYLSLATPFVFKAILFFLPALCALIIPLCINRRMRCRNLVVLVCVLASLIFSGYILRSITNNRIGVFVINKPISTEKLRSFLVNSSFKVSYDPDELTFFYDKSSVSATDVKRVLDEIINEK